MQPARQDNQLMSKYRVLGFKPQLRLEWRGQDGQHETEQLDHSASLGDSITSSTRIRFSVQTGVTGTCHLDQRKKPQAFARSGRSGLRTLGYEPSPLVDIEFDRAFASHF
jgi:hypothetical protein